MGHSREWEVPRPFTLSLAVRPRRAHTLRTESHQDSVYNNSVAGSFTPIPPAQGIEYYDPRTLNGQQSLELDFIPGSGKLDRVAIMMGKPCTESSQTLKGSNCVVWNGAGIDQVASFWANAAAIPVFLWDRSNLPLKGMIYAQHNFQVEARIEYVYPSPSGSAVEAYTKKKGDCADFSKLYVAALRNIGFPARTASGWWEGQDLAHVWSECYFPGSGWLVTDASQGDSLSPDGAYAYSFGNINDRGIRLHHDA